MKDIPEPNLMKALGALLKQRAVVVYDNNGKTPFSVWTLEQFRAEYRGKALPEHRVVDFPYNSALPDRAP